MQTVTAASVGRPHSYVRVETRFDTDRQAQERSQSVNRHAKSAGATMCIHLLRTVYGLCRA